MINSGPWGFLKAALPKIERAGHGPPCLFQEVAAYPLVRTISTAELLAKRSAPGLSIVTTTR